MDTTMQLFLDCLPCMLRQVLESARMATDNEQMQEKIMDDALKTLSGHRHCRTAPVMAQAMHAIVKQHTGVADPYAKVKTRDIATALKLEPLIKCFASGGPDVLLRALKVSATGNVMDAALYGSLDLESCLADEIEKPFAVNDIDAFKEELKSAGRILIIGDNAGELVFDKVLVRQLSRDYEVFYAVRGEPVINDATVEDARIAGLAEHTAVISTGCGVPGAVLELCSPEFRSLFDSADIVISKGQGNFEALSEVARRVYFLLKAKCPKVAKVLGVRLNEYVFQNHVFNILLFIFFLKHTHSAGRQAPLRLWDISP